MKEFKTSQGSISVEAADRELKRVLGAKVLGVSTYGPDRPISIWLDDSATAEDEQAAALIVSDPQALRLQSIQREQSAAQAKVAIKGFQGRIAQNTINVQQKLKAVGKG